MSVVTFPQVTLVGARARDVEAHLASAGIRVASLSASELANLAHPTARAPQLVMLDVRDTTTLPASVRALRKHHPDTAIVLVASALDPTLMLEAMRAGVTEIVPEPLTQASLESAIGRVWRPSDIEPSGQVLAIVGAKGGVGATTIAVNMATALAREAPGQVLLVDLHLAQGDAALLLGVEARFSVVDALENIHRLDEAYFGDLVVEAKGGPHLLASSDRHVVGAPGADRVRALLEAAARFYRHVVVDVPRNELTTLDGLEGARRIVVVLNQELSAIRSATRLVKALEPRYRGRLSVALARHDKSAEIETPDIERVVGLPVSYIVPNDYRTAVRAANQGVPVVRESGHRLAGALKAMAVDVAGITAKHESPAPASVGLLGRLSLRRT